MNPLHVVILAAGQGSRMHSKVPKVLHPLAGRPLLAWVIQAVLPLQPANIHVVYGHGGEAIRAAFSDQPLNWVEQTEQLGTAHALLQALPHLPDQGHVLVLAGDVPLIQTETLRKLCEPMSSVLTLLVAELHDPTGLGRIVRDVQHQVQEIVEEKDATSTQREIREIYSGVCVAEVAFLKKWLPRITATNSQKEYYLTDLVGLAVQNEEPIQTWQTPDAVEVQGVNTRRQLAMLERAWQQRVAYRLLDQGISIADPARLDVRGTLRVGADSRLDVNVVCEGDVQIGEGCYIAPHCVLKDVQIGAHTQVLAHSVLEGVVVGSHAVIGPFARLRPGTVLADHCKVGNFVEIKNTQLGAHAKANHLSYLGDATIGERVNIGAGTITCNYDGVHKHHTTIADDVFVGSGTQLIAPVQIGKSATIGAGTTLRSDAPAEALTLTKREQKTIAGWKKREK